MAAVACGVFPQGYNCEDDIEGLRDPHVAVHGSFSLMVNLHAVSKYFENVGGASVHSPSAEGFKVRGGGHPLNVARRAC